MLLLLLLLLLSAGCSDQWRSEYDLGVPTYDHGALYYTTSLASPNNQLSNDAGHGTRVFQYRLLDRKSRNQYKGYSSSSTRTRAGSRRLKYLCCLKVKSARLAVSYMLQISFDSILTYRTIPVFILLSSSCKTIASCMV